MSDLRWTKDGAETFEKLMGAVPAPMRDAIKPKLIEFLAAKAAGESVTGEVVKKMVGEDLPEPQKSMLMQVLDIKKLAEGKGKKKEKVTVPAAVTPAAAPGEWEGISQTMFERMLQEVPETLRDVFRGKLMDILKQKAKGGPFEEGHVVEIANEIVPEPFKSSILKAFSTMGGVDVGAVEKIIDTFPGGQEILISILHAIQAQFGYIPAEALKLVSQKKEVFLSTLYRLVTSYQSFRTEPPKRYTVTVCNGTGCHVRGSESIIKRLEEKISEYDSPITLEKIRCLGCCDLSPALMVNGEVYGGADVQVKLSEILGE